MRDPAEIVSDVQRVYRELLDPIAERFAYERPPGSAEVAGPPLVLLVGNHSSGKSTFVNHLLGQDVQSTGLAPTDDAFTVLAWGTKGGKREGRAVAGDPELPFNGLSELGPTFLSHFQRRTVNAELLRKVNLVDSPGMIDSARGDSGRGYDFTAVVRWFAERAELVLVFFDPDKPGTTGETLDVFTHALNDLSHKVRVVLNKVDTLRGMEDFARAYGALCWNLAKVMPRKDLPQIYTSFVPVPGAPRPALPLGDFEAARGRLEEAVLAAPALRADNMVNQLAEYTERLAMHARVLDRAAADARVDRRRAMTMGVGGSALVLTLAGLAATSGVSIELGAAVILGAVLFVLVALARTRRMLKDAAEEALRLLDGSFEQVHQRALLVRDHATDLRARWEAIGPRARKTLVALGVFAIPKLRRKDEQALEEAQRERIPALRRDVT